MINLPELMLLDSYENDWDLYINAVYEEFKKDFILNSTYYDDMKIGLRTEPIEREKVATFWHLVSVGAIEDQRSIEIERCERIKWPKVFIENHYDESFLVWENERKGKTNLCIYNSENRYITVLGERKDYYLLLTGYYVKENHRHEKLIKEYEAFKKTRALSK